jgi:hypothetical protein
LKGDLGASVKPEELEATNSKLLELEKINAELINENGRCGYSITELHNASIRL